MVKIDTRGTKSIRPIKAYTHYIINAQSIYHLGILLLFTYGNSAVNEQHLVLNIQLDYVGTYTIYANWTQYFNKINNYSMILNTSVLFIYDI